MVFSINGCDKHVGCQKLQQLCVLLGLRYVHFTISARLFARYVIADRIETTRRKLFALRSAQRSTNILVRIMAHAECIEGVPTERAGASVVL